MPIREIISDASKTQLLHLCTRTKQKVVKSQGYHLLACNATPCLGQVVTLFTTKASKIVYPVQESEGKKQYPVQ